MKQPVWKAILTDGHFWLPGGGARDRDQRARGGEVEQWRIIHLPRCSDSARTLHWLGVSCGFGAGAWLGAAEAPTNWSPPASPHSSSRWGWFPGVFVARWTVPMLLKGTGYICDGSRRRST
ncbi:MAG: hypothetical protein QM757_39005 [Paludibaculum sp.]